jgi:hypothetical protein
MCPRRMQVVPFQGSQPVCGVESSRRHLLTSACPLSALMSMLSFRGCEAVCDVRRFMSLSRFLSAVPKSHWQQCASRNSDAGEMPASLTSPPGCLGLLYFDLLVERILLLVYTLVKQRHHKSQTVCTRSRLRCSRGAVQSIVLTNEVNIRHMKYGLRRLCTQQAAWRTGASFRCQMSYCVLAKCCITISSCKYNR